MTQRPQRQTSSLLRLVLYALVVLILIISFLYAYELTGGVIDGLLEGIGDIIGQF